jgi:hypothetical protein
MTVAPGAAACCDVCLSAYGIESDGRTVDEMQTELYGLEEASFGGCQCDSCGSTYAGDRHEAHGIATERDERGDVDISHLSICTDCLLFHANGDEPEEWYQSPSDYREAGGLTW